MIIVILSVYFSFKKDKNYLHKSLWNFKSLNEIQINNFLFFIKMKKYTVSLFFFYKEISLKNREINLEFKINKMKKK